MCRVYSSGNLLLAKVLRGFLYQEEKDISNHVYIFRTCMFLA